MLNRPSSHISNTRVYARYDYRAFAGFGLYVDTIGETKNKKKHRQVSQFRVYPNPKSCLCRVAGKRDDQFAVTSPTTYVQPYTVHLSNSQSTYDGFAKTTNRILYCPLKLELINQRVKFSIFFCLIFFFFFHFPVSCTLRRHKLIGLRPSDGPEGLGYLTYRYAPSQSALRGFYGTIFFHSLFFFSLSSTGIIYEGIFSGPGKTATLKYR